MSEETPDRDETLNRNEFDPYLSNEKELKELLGIVADGLKFSPPLYADAILGHPWTLLPPHSRFSEYSIVSPFAMIRSLKYLVDATVPALPFEVPSWFPGSSDPVFWRATDILFQTDPDNNPYSFADEAWIFINGIGSLKASSLAPPSVENFSPTVND